MLRVSSGLPTVGTDLPVALLVGALLAWLGVLIARRATRGEPAAVIARLMIAGVLLHLVCAPLQIFVVDHFYAGVSDWLKYTHQGALLADMWRNGHFALAGSGVTGLLGNGATSIAGGVVMTVVGPNQLAAFFVGSWLAFVGCLFFYLAFRETFPRSDRRWYAALVFLFPSLLFWTADVSKESFMLFGLGLTAYGIALAMRGRRLGYLYLLLGGALCLFIRPDELVILAAGFALGMLIRSAWGRSGAFRRPRHPVTTIATFVFVGAAVVISAYVATHFLHSLTGQGLANSLNQLNANNQGSGVGFGSSNVSYSSNPLLYPRDVYTVLFDPLPFTAHGLTQFLAAGENILILVVIVFSLIPRLRVLPRVCLERPYVFTTLFYCLVFLYAFAALGNLGLITRERTLMLPFLFVVLAFPVARPGAEPYPWQRRSRRDQSPPRSGGPVAVSRDLVEVSAVVASAPAEWAAAERPGVDGSKWTVVPWDSDR